MTKENDFEYSSKMKDYYKSEDVAEEYNRAFSESGSWRHRLIASRERQSIKALLQLVPHNTVVDIPTGTGKLAALFAETESEVLACDISEQMLQIAQKEYTQAGVSDARFKICDAENVTETINGSFDVVICLRLLHRVPTEVKRDILSELGAVGNHVIASTAVETTYHSIRRNVRERLIGGDERDHCYESPDNNRRILSDGFEIVASKHVLPFLSQERVFLLRPTE